MAGVESHFGEELRDALLASRAAGEFVDVERFTDDVLDGHAGIERGVGVLEDDLHAAAHFFEIVSIEGSEISTIEGDLARGGFGKAEDGSANCGFAAATFADKAQSFSAVNVQVNPLDGGDAFEPFGQVFDID